ncbi:MAG: FkbM family methyltransferase, partial [Oscillospiraceae bacterium]
MIELLSESTSVWQVLKQCNKPILIYGMGDGALKIMRVFEVYNIKISGFFASDEFVRGHSFCGFKV